MQRNNFGALDLDVARTRIVLSLLAMLSLYADPSTAGGLFHLTSYSLITLLCHLGYSVTTYIVLANRPAPQWIWPATIVFDLVFATVIAYLTEGKTSPSYVFFVFAIIAEGIRTGLRGTLWMTLAGVSLYLLVVGLSEGLAGFYVMRAVYLGIAGYLVGFFGQQRINYEARMRELEAQSERAVIARSLHDSYVQSLAGVNLRLETCRELLRRGRPDDLSSQLAELQIGVAREYDQVRSYIRSLAGIEDGAPRELETSAADPMVEMRANFDARSRVAERIFLIALEGLRNARKHARANLVTIDAAANAESFIITVSDDGIGFPPDAGPPWTIASHVAESGGQVHIEGNHPAQLKVAIPRASDVTNDYAD
ncbi:MAG TPA: histidine kinase [Candidatus Binataceae bacterium]|nr:histidine kinase [Candidatus Binataceae bacterium]